MKFSLWRPLGVVLTAATFTTAFASPVYVKPTPAPYAQQLADNVIKSNPDIIDILVHVAPPGAKNQVVAAHLPKDLGEISGDDDMGVATSGTPVVEVQKDGTRIGVLVQMKDAKGAAIGALGLMYPYRTGDDQQAVLARSVKIRDQLAARIPSVDKLFQH